MIKYFCDVCGEEIPTINDVVCVKVQDNSNVDRIMACSLCRNCNTKVFKPVKTWQSKILIRIPLNKETE